MDENRLKIIIQEFVKELTEILKELEQYKQKEIISIEKPDSTDGLLSTRTLVELASHEGVVLEAYKDSKGIWTWGIGVTNMSGHNVMRYKDNPQSLERVFEIYEWLLRTKYLPDVLEAFKGFDLTEEQLAAALSFHYNTGGIKRASWVRSFKAGKINQAKREFMNWRSPKEIIPRREKERDLFFEGRWDNTDGLITVYEVRKPSYSPKWSSAKQIKYKG